VVLALSHVSTIARRGATGPPESKSHPNVEGHDVRMGLAFCCPIPRLDRQATIMIRATLEILLPVS
jgi:hypothetical protein